MKQDSIDYWDDAATGSICEVREAVLAGHRRRRDFEEAGRLDAAILLVPFVRQSDTVVDVGCGIGRLLRWVAPRCRTAIGIDVSERMIERAAAELREIENVELRLLPRSLKFPIRARSVDFAYFYHVCEHLPRETAVRMLQEIARTLKEDGQALVQFSLLCHPDNQAEFMRWVRRDDPEDVRSRMYGVDEVELMLAMVDLHPAVRIFVPGEYVAIVTKRPSTVLGGMPSVRFRADPRP